MELETMALAILNSRPEDEMIGAPPGVLGDANGMISVGELKSTPEGRAAFIEFFRAMSGGYRPGGN